MTERAKTERGNYRSIPTVLARGKDFRTLSPAAKLVFYTLKLELGPSGIDVYDLELLPKYTGLRAADAEKACEELRDTGWVDWEDNVVWIIRGLEFEPSHNHHNSKHRTGVQTHLNGLPRLPVVARFRAYYAWWLAGEDKAIGEVSDGLSDGIGRVSGSHSIQGNGIRKTERETDTDKTLSAADAAPSGDPALDLGAPEPDPGPSPSRRSSRRSSASGSRSGAAARVAGEDVGRVFAFYEAKYPRARPRTDKNERRVRALLARGYSVRDLCDAIEGNADDDWCVRNFKHDLPWILEDRRLDGFIQRGQAATTPAVGADGALTPDALRLLGVA